MEEARVAQAQEAREAQRRREQLARLGHWEAIADEWASKVRAALLIQVRVRGIRPDPTVVAAGPHPSIAAP